MWDEREEGTSEEGGRRLKLKGSGWGEPWTGRES